MDYVEHRPEPDLAPLIECLWSLSGAADPHAVERVVPDGCIEIVVHLGEPFRVWTSPDRAETQPAAIVAGQLSRVLLLSPPSRADTFGIRLRPGRARAILHASLAGLLDRTPSLADVCGADADRLVSALRGSPAGERATAAISWLRARLAAGVRPADAVLAAVDGILARRGDVRIEALAAEVGCTTRHLERAFALDVGTTPKRLARIVRLNGVVHAIRAGAGGDWSGLALELGFADQSHLIREFSSLVGRTPADPEALDGGMNEHFTSAARLASYFGDDG